MNEVELTSELAIAMLDGVQDKKNSIDGFYQRYDDSFPERSSVETRFRAVIDALTDAIGDDLEETEFRRAPLFYSLFCATCHRMYGLPRVQLPTAEAGRLTRPDKERLQETLRELSNVLTEAREAEGTIPQSYERFVTACLRQTDNIRPRQTRLEAIYRGAFV
jgi:hypothetical protein